MRDVAERPGVDYHGLALAGLHYVGLNGVAEQGHHGADRADVLGGDGGSVGGAGLVGVADYDAAQPGAEIVEVSGQREDGHDFGGGYDVEAALADGGVVRAADAGHYGAEGAVFNVGDAPPCDALRPEAVYLSALRHVVGERGEKVVRRADSVGVAGEVDVDFILRLYEAETAAGSASLDAEDGAERGLSEGGDDILAQPSHRLGETDRRGGLALARWGGRYAGDDDHLAALSVVPDGVESYLGLVVAIGDDRVGAESQILRYVHDGPHRKTSVKRRATAGGLAS